MLQPEQADAQRAPLPVRHHRGARGHARLLSGVVDDVDLAQLPGPATNDDWKNPHDPDPEITDMKDGRTHLAHKAEHAVDLDTGAVVAITVQPATVGDTHTVYETLGAANRYVRSPQCLTGKTVRL